jgi:hypothetical protein
MYKNLDSIKKQGIVHLCKFHKCGQSITLYLYISWQNTSIYLQYKTHSLVCNKYSTTNRTPFLQKHPAKCYFIKIQNVPKMSQVNIPCTVFIRV